jgi:hypothetical protein
MKMIQFPKILQTQEFMKFMLIKQNDEMLESLKKACFQQNELF